MRWGNPDGSAYPPYNIERVSDDAYVLTMAVDTLGHLLAATSRS